MSGTYRLYALRFATRDARRAAHFSAEVSQPDEPMPMDYFVWLATNSDRTVLIDTGFKADVAARKRRTYVRSPLDALKQAGVELESIQDIVLTHLHYDHVGMIDSFPWARLHLQENELVYAAGPGSVAARRAFEPDDLANLMAAMYDNRLVLYDGSSSPWPGIGLHLVGGHTPGTQVVRVRTERGWVVFASDASHFYENLTSGITFSYTQNTERNAASFSTMLELADSPDHVIPGHDPLVMGRYPPISSEFPGLGVRLDLPPLGSSQ